ncbi:MAG TPA: hypothetical protein VHG10_08235 [Glycomyces sp.]|nr:hypothetical protein [Glycomyces sp.]
MTVPPNYGPPPEQPHTPGYGYQSPYNGGQNPYGSQPQQPQPGYGGGGQQPPFGQDPSPYGGPVLPPEPPKRNLGLIGGVIVGALVLVLGGALLVTMNLRGNDQDSADGGGGGGDETSQEASEDATTPEEATTPAEDTGSEVGQCTPYETVVSGSGFGLVDCADPTAFWKVVEQSYDVTDIAVDADGELVDPAQTYAVCGDTWGLLSFGDPWTKIDYVYSSGSLDSLYCLQATGNPDPAEPAHLPIMPDVGDCFDDSDSWWSVDCSSDLAVYKAVDTIVFDEPIQDMTEDQASEEAASCNSDWYWKVTDADGRTSAMLCANDV